MLGLQPRTGLTPRRLSVEALVDWRALIVLDNCEHVVDAAAALANDLVRGCPAVAILVTSREPLRAAGEHVWPVRALPIEPDGVELFAQRALEVRPDLAIDEATRPVVADMCRHLDGMPLAIELAAARMRSMSVVELAGRLGQRFRLPSAGRAATEARQHCVRWWRGAMTC